VITAGRLLGALSLLLGALVPTFGLPGGLSSASAATVVAESHCRGLDPNLVHGACLRYQVRSTTAYTWIGSYRASNGQVFFCIDYLYDSRIAGRPTVVSTNALVNQFGHRVGANEVAALNYLISTWAAHGSTGSNPRDAAIALIIRELMSDGVRPNGVVVYPGGLRAGQPVRPPIGGLDGSIMKLAGQMWAAASAYRGPYRLQLAATETGPIELGRTRDYQVTVLSAAGHWVPGVLVQFACSGPVSCPGSIRSATTAVQIAVQPAAVGEFRVTATAAGPAANGRIYQVGSWLTHGGSTAQNHGIQRGWIAQSTTTAAVVGATARIVKGTPIVVTRASDQAAAPGALLHDVVTVSGLPAGYHQQATATLFGPFAQQPGPTSCTTSAVHGQVTFVVDHSGVVTTPAIAVSAPGYYVWVESLPGDVRTNALTTPCGVAAETTVVAIRPPVVRTQASAQHALLGRSVHDTVLISGLGVGDKAQVGWRLRGPLASRGTSCAGLVWKTAPVAASGSFAATRNGSYVTAAVVLRAPGCFSYEEEVAATATTGPASSPAGTASETLLVTRPVTPFVPEVPTGLFVAISRGGQS
jgi:hypothetical protein